MRKDMSWLCPRCGLSALGTPGARCPVDGAVLARPEALAASPNDDRLGRVVAGKYAIFDVLGRGGFGAVYAGWQEPPGRIIAIKLLRRDVAHRVGVVERFFREAQVVARINHPGAVALYDYGADADGALYMAFELVEGVTLDVLLARSGGWLPVERATRIIRGVLDVLIEAHAEGAVHRDLKPGNIMVHADPEGVDHVKVLDFGIAKVVNADAGQAITLAGQAGFIGTPRYMAPEQAQGLAVDGRADLYSVGVLFFELLAGFVPFEARSPFATLLAHQEAPIPELPVEVGAPRAIQGVVRTALAKSPLDRFPDAASMRRAIDLASGEGAPIGGRASLSEIVELGPPPASAQPRAAVTVRARVGLAALVGMVATGTAVWVARPPSSPGLAVRPPLAVRLEARDPLSVVRGHVTQGNLLAATAALAAALAASGDAASLWARALADHDLREVRAQPAFARWRGETPPAPDASTGQIAPQEAP